MSAARTPWRLRRAEDLAGLGAREWDLVVVGGGITGAGIAWQAARHGLGTLLLEARDWAGGTSSRSSKLVHGGLRYLPRGEISLVRQVGREREALERLWPHLVRPLPFLIPDYRGRSMPLSLLGAGVWAYDRLTGVPPEHRRRMLRPRDVQVLESGLRRQGLLGGVRYFEARTDDARLVYAVVQAARAAGCTALSRVRVAEMRLRDGRGELEAVDVETGQSLGLAARAVVNATGPWVSEVDPEGPRMALGRGCHLVFARESLPLRHAVALPAPDGANTFAVPRHRVTYVGTTDRICEGDPALPDVPDEDVSYLLDLLAYTFPEAHLGPRDLLAVYAGVRPLVAREGSGETRELSRRQEVDVRRDGLISVRGGKLTGFRGMAQEVLDRLRRAGLPVGAAPDDEAPAPMLGDEAFAASHQLRAEALAEIVERHGAKTPELLRYAAERRDGLRPVADGASLTWGEVDWAAEFEEVCHLSDLLIRRTALLWFGGLREPEAVLRPVAERIAPTLGWSPERVDAEVGDCRRQAHLDRLAELRGEGPTFGPR